MSTLRELRPTWADVDLGRFAANVDVLARSLPERARFCAVLKADAYGHGAVEMARALPKSASMIAVALFEEALQLRRAGIELPILVLGSLSDEQILLAMRNRIEFGVVGPEELRRVCAKAGDREVGIHLKLDSGMGRMGVVAGELGEVMEMIRATPRLRIDSIYTHMANADDESDPFTERQIAAYDAMLATLRDHGIDAPLHHFANSAATLRGLVRPGDVARVGIAMYGPRRMEIATGTIAPVMRWRTEIVRLKELPAGHAIGYGTTFHTSRPSRIATLPVGYADGYDRLLSNNAEVVVRGQRVPVVGRVSMDLVTIDVTDLPEAAIGDEVELLGDGVSAEELATRTQTISYEVFCRITSRVPRIYRDGSGFRIRSRFVE